MNKPLDQLQHMFIFLNWSKDSQIHSWSTFLFTMQEHVRKLTTVDMEVIHGSGAPSGEKHVLCWLPPETKNGDRRSVYKEAVKIVVCG